ncbi:hypothetical protein [Paraburkholderia rhizosphaerae]|uniref:hypothetical protein n=1 Tax=Paraburkholderia rhizosphaerae TaxID=480658 RepID=UPI001064E22C|nr:hypothetical protein [Paraburkholderia rhizosphaerae]
MNATLLRFWRISRWHLKRIANGMNWQRTTAAGLLMLWAGLMGVIDLPLQRETRQIAERISGDIAHDPVGPGAVPHAPDDLTGDFVASLPAFDRCTEQLRSLNLLAEKSGVMIASAHYRYEPMPGLPITRVTVGMDVRGNEKQQRRFLQMMLNAFANLAISRLAYSKGAEESDKGALRQRLDIHMYFRANAKAST